MAPSFRYSMELDVRSQHSSLFSSLMMRVTTPLVSPSSLPIRLTSVPSMTYIPSPSVPAYTSPSFPSSSVMMIVFFIPSFAPMVRETVPLSITAKPLFVPAITVPSFFTRMHLTSSSGIPRAVLKFFMDPSLVRCIMPRCCV